MLYILLVVGLTLCTGIYCKYASKGLDARIRIMERDLHNISEMVAEMVEVQVKTFQKHSAGLEGLEERIMELCVPSHDSTLPLERRHQVLALARQGVALEDIVKHLKTPVGEAEVILNLQKYMGAGNARSLATQGQVRHHV